MTPSDAVNDVARTIKRHGAATIAQVAADLNVSYETARHHVSTLDAFGFVESSRDLTGVAGRPATVWRLTNAGEHLFPKRYAELADVLISALEEIGDADRMRHLLQRLVDAKVASWQPALAGLDLDARLERLRDIYINDDPFVSVEYDEHGPILVERNCPYLDVATRHEALCGLTVNTLSRLLGRRVVRETTFQNGDGRCTFRVTDDPDTGVFVDEPRLRSAEPLTSLGSD